MSCLDCEERAEECWELEDENDQPCTCPCHDSVEYRRASGEVICEPCSKPYRVHAQGGPIGMDGRRFLRRLCDGSLVRL